MKYVEKRHKSQFKSIPKYSNKFILDTDRLEIRTQFELQKFTQLIKT